MRTALFLIEAAIGIGFLVIFHEFGHFVSAKLFGIKVETFSLGLGPLLLKKRYGETNYGISAIPIGGYVKLLGMELFEEVDPGEENRTYRSQPIWKRVIVIFSGAFFNLILPTFLIFFIFIVYGVPMPANPTKTIDLVLEKTPAARAGLRNGDTIETINGRRFESWNSIRHFLRSNPGRKISIGLMRDDKRKTVTAILENKKGKGFLGVQPEPKRERLGLFTTIKESLVDNYNLIKLTIVGYYRLLTGQLGPVSKSLSGPVGIAVISVKTIRSGLEVYLTFLAFLSVNLGILNSLPLLPLDGGHLLFNGIEAVTRKPIRQEVKQVVSVMGLTLLITVMAYVMYLDILRVATKGLSGW